MNARFANSVGVAPGTLTIQLSGISPKAILPPGGSLLPQDTCPPEMKRWMAFDRGSMTPSGGGAMAGVRAFSPYGEFYQLSGRPRRKGLFGLAEAAITDQTRSHIRWDIIAIVGGGALGIAMAAGLIASALGK